MKIVIFTENNRAGGMDTFYPNLIENWPAQQDEFIFICNASHPGLDFLSERLPPNCKLIKHNVMLNWQLSKTLFGFLPAQMRRLTQPLLRVVLYPYQLWAIKRLFNSLDADFLVSVNGGYPGGETCRVANIAWYQLGRGKSVHNIRNFAVKPRALLGVFERHVDQRLSESVSAFIGVSNACAESLRIRKSFSSLQNILGVYNGLPIRKLSHKNGQGQLRELCKIPSDAPLALMLATYEPRKGHEFLFNAMKRVFEARPDAHLVICGDGDAQDVAKVTALRHKLLENYNVHLLGFQANGSSLIDDADVLLIASQEFESFGWTAIEAMVRGCPVVSTDVGGLTEVIGKDKKAGYCHSISEVNSYADSVLELLSDKKKRAHMGQNGRNRVKTLFSAKKMASSYYDLIIGK